MSESRGARLVASSWPLVFLSGLLLFLRLYCKLWRGRGLWWDDHLLVVSWASLVIAVSIDTYIVSLGFGSHIWTISAENLRTINLFTILVAAFGIMATTISKTSFSMTLYRIAMDRWMKCLLVYIIITSNLSLNLVWIFGLTKCTPFEKVLDRNVPGTCWDKSKLLRYQLAASYYSAALDFVLAILPWHMLMGMSLRRREMLGVTIAMSLGAVAGITAIVRSVLVASMTSQDFTYDRVDLTIWTLAEPAASIMAISIPVLRMLYHELKSGNRSYPRNPSQQSNSDQAASGNRLAEQNSSRRMSERIAAIRSRYGQNTTVIMSNPRWQSSEEALQDKGGRDPGTPPGPHGVLKTEEVGANHEILDSTYDGNSIPLTPLPATYRSPFQNSDVK
ncbi:hypothetical protein S7711_03455 [Stachybotrys chartarum IBT 7711]|uniref:Rhodopsin domain-containing protein n=1 Tax=Stachybotrys chartarum (strain CBS 109288 / IBT 7711) TaxID=1280523 RepID=A0A084AFT3_STACB|nr:hypothetical protein S7711_03455 [Stachybotrys chartarum IBT 7711]KFA55264.1 hypothetical protein S40293_04936 [Stachybotrys chartarum IBT 40293]